MKIIIGDRYKGKTERLIQMSAESQAYIVVRDHRTAYSIAQRATAAGLKIPFPLTYQEFIDKQFGSAVRFLIDDADALLSHLARGRLEAISLTSYPVDGIETL